MDNQQKPKGYENVLSAYGAQILDGVSGEPLGWGFEILSHLGDEGFNALREFGTLECLYPDWFLITKKLTFQDAIKKYGKVTQLIVGPKGGWRSITFGKTKFIARQLNPTWQERQEFVDPLVVEVGF